MKNAWTTTSRWPVVVHLLLVVVVVACCCCFVDATTTTNLNENAISTNSNFSARRNILLQRQTRKRQSVEKQQASSTNGAASSGGEESGNGDAAAGSETSYYSNQDLACNICGYNGNREITKHHGVVQLVLHEESDAVRLSCDALQEHVRHEVFDPALCQYIQEHAEAPCHCQDVAAAATSSSSSSSSTYQGGGENTSKQQEENLSAAAEDSAATTTSTATTTTSSSESSSTTQGAGNTPAANDSTSNNNGAASSPSNNADESATTSSDAAAEAEAEACYVCGEGNTIGKNPGFYFDIPVPPGMDGTALEKELQNRTCGDLQDWGLQSSYGGDCRLLQMHALELCGCFDANGEKLDIDAILDEDLAEEEEDYERCHLCPTGYDVSNPDDVFRVELYFDEDSRDDGVVLEELPVSCRAFRNHIRRQHIYMDKPGLCNETRLQVVGNNCTCEPSTEPDENEEVPENCTLCSSGYEIGNPEGVLYNISWSYDVGSTHGIIPNEDLHVGGVLTYANSTCAETEDHVRRNHVYKYRDGLCDAIRERTSEVCDCVPTSSEEEEDDKEQPEDGRCHICGYGNTIGNPEAKVEGLTDEETGEPIEVTCEDLNELALGSEVAADDRFCVRLAAQAEQVCGCMGDDDGEGSTSSGSDEDSDPAASRCHVCSHDSDLANPEETLWVQMYDDDGVMLEDSVEITCDRLHDLLLALDVYADQPELCEYVQVQAMDTCKCAHHQEEEPEDGAPRRCRVCSHDSDLANPETTLWVQLHDEDGELLSDSVQMTCDHLHDHLIESDAYAINEEMCLYVQGYAVGICNCTTKDHDHHEDDEDHHHEDDEDHRHEHEDGEQQEQVCRLCGPGFQVGNPLAKIRVELYDEDGQVIEENELPCIRVEDYVMRMNIYAEQPELCEAIIVNAGEVCNCTSVDANGEEEQDHDEHEEGDADDDAACQLCGPGYRVGSYDAMMKYEIYDSDGNVIGAEEMACGRVEYHVVGMDIYAEKPERCQALMAAAKELCNCTEGEEGHDNGNAEDEHDHEGGGEAEENPDACHLCGRGNRVGNPNAVVPIQLYQEEGQIMEDILEIPCLRLEYYVLRTSTYATRPELCEEVMVEAHEICNCTADEEAQPVQDGEEEGVENEELSHCYVCGDEKSILGAPNATLSLDLHGQRNATVTCQELQDFVFSNEAYLNQSGALCGDAFERAADICQCEIPRGDIDISVVATFSSVTDLTQLTSEVADVCPFPMSNESLSSMLENGAQRVTTMTNGCGPYNVTTASNGIAVLIPDELKVCKNITAVDKDYIIKTERACVHVFFAAQIDGFNTSTASTCSVRIHPNVDGTALHCDSCSLCSPESGEIRISEVRCNNFASSISGAMDFDECRPLLQFAPNSSVYFNQSHYGDDEDEKDVCHICGNADNLIGAPDNIGILFPGTGIVDETGELVQAFELTCDRMQEVFFKPDAGTFTQDSEFCRILSFAAMTNCMCIEPNGDIVQPVYQSECNICGVGNTIGNESGMVVDFAGDPNAPEGGVPCSYLQYMAYSLSNFTDPQVCSAVQDAALTACLCTLPNGTVLDAVSPPVDDDDDDDEHACHVCESADNKIGAPGNMVLFPAGDAETIWITCEQIGQIGSSMDRDACSILTMAAMSTCNCTEPNGNVLVPQYHSGCNICGGENTIGNEAGMVYFELDLPCSFLQFMAYGLENFTNPELCQAAQDSAFDGNCQCTMPNGTVIGDDNTPPAGSSNPSNDRCESAKELQPSDPSDFYLTVRGSARNATPEDVAVTSCGMPRGHRGVWFQLAGTGTAVNATLGAVDAVISVFVGDCDFMSCISYDYGSDYYYDFNPASTTWIAEQGQTYYILISSSDDYSELDRYHLTVFTYQTPDNDACSGATLIGSLPYSTNDTTQGSLTDFGLATCGVTSTSRGVWYQYTPQGPSRVIRARALGSSFDLVLAVFVGSCEFLLCTDSVRYDRYSGDGGAVLEWVGERDTTYLLLITGSDARTTGNFVLQLEEYTPPNNDECTNASQIADLPFVVHNGTTVGSVPEFVVAPFCETAIDSRGVWYNLPQISSSRVMRATLMYLSQDAYSSRAVLAVMRGDDCTFLDCLSSRYDSYTGYVGDATLREWIAEADTTYRILVASRSFHDVGNFRLAVHELAVPENDVCEQAISVSELPFSHSGSTQGASTDMPFVATCGLQTGQSRGVWYKLRGNDMVARVSLIATTGRNEYGFGPRMISVFAASFFDASSSCDYLECEGFNSDQYVISNSQLWSKYEWFARNDTVYYILISGREFGAVGRYDLRVSQLDPPPNDKCTSATSVATLPYTTQGSTEGASLEFDFPTCGVHPQSQGVWYSIEGMNKVVKVSMGTSRDAAQYVSVFSGPCSMVYLMQCQGYATSGRQSSTSPYYVLETAVDVFMRQGETYSIVAANYYSPHDFNSRPYNDKFQLQLTELETPDNSACVSARAIGATPYMDKGSTAGAIMGSAAMSCQGAGSTTTSTFNNTFAALPLRGVWYSFTGAGNAVTVQVSAFFDTQISVFTGSSCEELVCVANAARGYAHDVARPASFTWTAVQLQDYYIFVAGHEFEDAGRYRLKLTNAHTLPTAASQLFEDSSSP